MASVWHHGPDAKRQPVMQVYLRCIADKKEYGVLDVHTMVFLLTI